MTRGLSGSGKSFWAKEQVNKAQGNTIIVCKDNIREMLHDSQHSKGREELVKKVRNNLIVLALSEGKNVIVADTNFDNHESDIRAVVDNWSKENNKQVEFKIQSFEHIPLQVCIDRDSQRPKPLGEKVIRDQYKRWIKKSPDVLEQDESLRKAIIVDVDGTLAHMSDRGPFDWHRVHEDLVDNTVAQIVRDYYGLGYTILIVSGRDAVCQKLTEEWLFKNGILYHEIFMRPEGDMRKDNLIKEEIFNNNVFGKWNVKFVLDDRDQVVRFWRSIGLKCLQVAEGDF